MSERVWYYTTGHALTRILEKYAIETDTMTLSNPPIDRVWLSTMIDWDPAFERHMTKSDGTKTLVSLEDTAIFYGGLYRLEVQDEGRFAKWTETGRSALAKAFEKYIRDRRHGNPKYWRFSDVSISLAKCNALEKRVNGVWRDEPFSGSSFREMLEEMIDASRSLIEQQKVMPGLVLIYSAIDILAWLGINDATTETTMRTFVEWVNAYMASCPRFPKCSAEDLYGARCSLLHTRTTESRSSRAGIAKQLLYAFGNRTTEQLQRQIDLANWDALPIHADDLVDSVEHGLGEFSKYLNSNREHAVKVRQKAGRMLPTGEASAGSEQKHAAAFGIILKSIVE